MTFGIVEVVLLLCLVLAIGIAIYAHTTKGKAELATIEAKISAAHDKFDAFVAGFHLGASQPSEPIVQTPVPSTPAPVNYSQYATVQEAILALQGKVGADEVTRNWAAAHPGSDPTKVADPTGVRDTSPTWTAFDGHANRASFQPNTPVTFSVNVGKPFVFSLSECPGTDPSATMTITATRNGSQVATISRHFGQAVDLSVPVGDAVLTAVSDKVTVADATIRQG
jgi:hypothetical protein